MKILVLSDSHSSLYFMRQCIASVRPDAVIHLGDHIDDGEAMAQENPHIRFWLVPGNCDAFRCLSWQPAVICCSVGGVNVFMTHGHLHGVKSGMDRLLADARKQCAQIVVFGHTHESLCFCQEDGLWVLNPGTCRSSGGSVGLIEVDDNKISSCRILRQEDLETGHQMRS